jgi:hypothetical protein
MDDSAGCQPQNLRPLTFARGRLWHNNPNYSSGRYAKIRAGAEARLTEKLRELPTLMMAANQVRGHKAVRAIAGELEKADPASWTRPMDHGHLHLPWRSVPAAHAFLARMRRLREWVGKAWALFKGARFLQRLRNASSNASNKTTEAERQRREAEKDRLRRWAQDQGVPWSP